MRWLRNVLCAFSILMPILSVRAEEGAPNRFEMLPFLGSAPIEFLVSAPSDPERIYALSSDGFLLRSFNGGATFFYNSTRLDTVVYQLQISVHPSDADELYVVLNGKVFHSTDAGLVLQRLQSSFSYLFFDPHSPGHLLALAGGKLFDFDLEVGWTERPSPLPAESNASFQGLLFDPSTPGHVLLGASGVSGDGARGIYESSDGGETWMQRLVGVNCRRLLPDPHETRRVWSSPLWDVGVAAADSSLWRSDDFGRTWVNVPLAGAAGPLTIEWVNELEIDSRRPGYLLLVARQSGQSVLLLSRDAGASWSPLTLPVSKGIRAALARPNGQWLLALSYSDSGLDGLLQSEDVGATWRPLRSIAGRALAVAADPHDPDQAWIASPTGVFRTTNGGQSWNPVWTADPLLESAQLLVDPVDSRVIYLAYPRRTAGPYFWRSDDRGQTWQVILRSSGEIEAGDLLAGRRGSEDFVIASFFEAAPYGFLWRSRDQGRTWQLDPLERLGPLASDPEDGTVYQAADSRLWASNDAGSTFEPGQSFEALNALPIRLAGGPDHRLYVVTRDEVNRERTRMFSVLPGQAPVERLLPGDARYTDVDVFLADSRTQEIFFAAQTFGSAAHTFWRSDDTGKSWIDLHRGLPEDKLRALAFGAEEGELWVLPEAYGVFRGRFGSNPPLTLHQGRFEIEATWRDFSGRTGAGRARYLTEDTGYFWFFSPNNVELAVKILDGRPLNNSWWVFYGSLTNVEFDLLVKDLQSGQTRTYHNEAGRFASYGDVQALPEFLQSLTAPSRLESGGEATLFAGRFSAELYWRDFLGNAGFARPRVLTEDTVTFSVFSPENIELIVKLLDGRLINGRFWIFYGSLTNIEFQLVVRDAWTGNQVTYENPLGQFASRGDTHGLLP